MALLTSAAPAHTGESTVAPVEDQVERFDNLFRESARGGGSYLLAYRNADQFVTRGYGSVDCLGRVPMPSDALFDGGSLTKLFTTAAVFKLVQSGKLKLDDRLGDIFSGMPTEKRAITVAQLLAHRSGIPNFLGPKGRTLSETEWGIESYDYTPLRRAELLGRIRAARLVFRPGTDEAYSNTGFTLLAAVIEAASGEPYESYVREAVFIPAGMRNTGYLLMDRGSLPVTQQCRDGRAWGDPLSRRVWKTGVSWNLIGAGGRLTTLTDLLRFTAAIEDGPLFRPDIRERFQQLTYGSSARCKTSSAALGGSNGMTRSLILHLPRRHQTMIAVATHRERALPAEDNMLRILCP